MKPFRNLLAAALGLLLAISTPALAQVASQFVNAQTGTTYTFLTTDQTKLVTFNNAAATAVTLPRAGSNDAFNQGWYADVENIGAGIVTITPATSTINGATSYGVGQNQSVRIVSDGTNYQELAQTTGVTQPFGNFRNYIDNGGMAVQQRGTGTQTGATTSAAVASNYATDRWLIDTNVTSGAGRGKAVTTSLPAGYSGALNVFRTSGALLQAVCAHQIIPTADATQLAGQRVVLSFWAKADAGLTENGNVINASIITGTGADEGFASWTASPAITPAFTGVATAQNAVATTITTSWARFTMPAVVLATTETELDVAICFTPTASGAGATDGFFLTGVQLEQSAGIASPFEFRPLGIEVAKAQRYYWQIADPAATVPLPSSCFVTAANTTVKCGLFLPVQMRVAPTTAVSVATSFGIVVTAGTAGTCTTLAATASSNTLGSVGLTCTTGGTIALGSATPLIGAGTAGIVTVSADF